MTSVEHQAHSHGTHLVAGKVDAHSPLFQQVAWKLILVARHTRDHDIAQRRAVFDGPALLLYDLMLALAYALATRELLHTCDVDAVDAGAVVGQQRGERPAHHLGAIDHTYRASEQAVPVRQDRVVDVQVLQDLDHGQRRARQNGFHGLLVVQEPNVLVHVEDVLVAEALDVLAHIHNLLQVLVLSVVEDRVVHDNPVDSGVVVGRHDRLFDVVFGDIFERILEPT